MLDISGDFLLLDNLESVTLHPPLTVPPAVGYDTLTNCVLTEPYTIQELTPSGGQVLKNGTRFVWPRSQSGQPRLGSIIIDSDGTYWTVVQITDKQHVDVHEVVCVDLAVVNHLDNTATVLQAQSYSKDAAGEAVPNWVTLETGIPARWQPMTEEAQIFEDADYTRTTYRVTLGAALFANPQELAGGDYRLVDKDGNHYRVLQYTQENRIDVLPYAICVMILEGTEYADYGSVWSGQ
jgi:hypothetical protein